VAVEIVGERLLHVLLDCSGQRQPLAQHLARRQRDDNFRRRHRSTVGELRKRVDRRAPCVQRRRGIALQRDPRRLAECERAVPDSRLPQYGGIGREREDGPQATPLHRRARRGGDERSELVHPPAPEGGEAEAMREVAHPSPEVSDCVVHGYRGPRLLSRPLFRAAAHARLLATGAR
jgi:hypothetical protein